MRSICFLASGGVQGHPQAICCHICCQNRQQ
jgi:hypothetical protein